MTEVSKRQTVVEAGTELKGSLGSACEVVISGRFEGELVAPCLRINKGGFVNGATKVGEVICEGALAGQLEADTVELSGSIQDNTVIRAKTLEVQLTADEDAQVTFGDCELVIGDEPTEDP